MAYSKEQIRQVLRQAGWPESLIEVMAAIGIAESSGDPNIINPGVGKGGKPTNEYSVGLFQINTLVHKNYSIEQLKNPLINAREALRIYKEQGLKAWGAYTDKRYLQYLSGEWAGLLGGGSQSGSAISNTVGDVLGLGDLKRYLFEDQMPTPEERFAPYLNQNTISPQGRVMMATAIIVVIVAFVWGEF